MRILQAAVVVAVVMSTVCASTDDDRYLPAYVQSANFLFNKVQTRLTYDITELNTSISKIDKVTNTLMSTTVDNISELRNTIEAMGQKIKNTLTRMSAMENKLQIIDQAAKTQDLTDLKASVQTTLDQKTSNLATTTKVEELLNTHLENMKQTVTEVKPTCEGDASLTKVLQEVGTVKKDVAKVINETQATKEDVEQCRGEDTMTKVEALVDSLQNDVQDAKNSLEAKLNSVKEGVEGVFNNTQPPTSGTPPPGTELIPCDDSTFRGTSSINTCQSAMRFKKCKVPIVSFHCCHTCTAEGHLPDMGPWRYEDEYRNKSRLVSTLDVIKFFAP